MPPAVYLRARVLECPARVAACGDTTYLFWCSQESLVLSAGVIFRVLGAVLDQETIAVGSQIRELQRLRRWYGLGRWRKRKGIARIELPNGTIRTAELHWYEAPRIGKKEFKIKRFFP